MKIPPEWRRLAVKTITAIEKIDRRAKRNQALRKSILEFSQLLAMLALMGGNDLDGGDGDDKGDTAQGGGADTGGERF